jgi:hypothetical protein
VRSRIRGGGGSCTTPHLLAWSPCCRRVDPFALPLPLTAPYNSDQHLIQSLLLSREPSQNISKLASSLGISDPSTLFG